MKNRLFIPAVQHLFVTMLLVLLTHASPSLASAHFNTLLYHHVDDSTPRSTSVTPEEFAQHMAFLKQGNYHVMRLQAALDAVQNNRPLPDNSVVITFDDAWRNIYDNAIPIMEQHGYPFTIFINTDFVDDNNRMGMTWDMLRDIKQRGGTLANHTRDHGYLVRKNWQNNHWLADALANINHAQQRLETETGSTPKWLAYPYGEYNAQLKQAVKDLGYIGFGQHSGGIAHFSDWQALPRFPAAGIYSDLNKLKVKLNSQPLPVDYTQLPEVMLSYNAGKQNPPLLQATMVEGISQSSKNRFNCFILGQAVTPQWTDNETWQVTATKPLPLGRNRYNCTAPVAGKNNYYWFSHQWLVQDKP